MPAPAPRALAASGIAVEVSALREAWTEIVAEVREKSRFLGEALGGRCPLPSSFPG